jgi:hypothetical protein
MAAMTNGHSSVGGDSDRSDHGTVSPRTLEVLRKRGTRRRRARQDRRRSAAWVVGRSRRRTVRTFAVCVGALLLMALGLYFGLAHQESSGPVESAAPLGAVGAAGIV